MTKVNVVDLSEKFDLVFRIGVFGENDTDRERAFALQPNKDFNDTDQLETTVRNYANWRKDKSLPRATLALIVRKLIDAGIEIVEADFRIKPIDDFRNHLTSQLSKPQKLDKENCAAAVEDYFGSRDALQTYCLNYYLQAVSGPIVPGYDAPFPLLVDSGWMLSIPVVLDKDLEHTLLTQISDTTSTEQFEAEARRLSKVIQDTDLGNRKIREIALASSNAKRTRSDNPPSYDGPCWRLMSVSAAPDAMLRTLHFQRSSYFGYLETLELLATEAAVARRKYQRLADAGDLLALRGPPNDAFNVSAPHRNSIAGVNTITLLRERDQFRFWKHLRKDVAEAVNTHHVVPAGTFQPNVPEGTEAATSGRWKAEFSILDTIMREFCEEVLGLLREIRDSQKDASISFDWKRGVRAAPNVAAFERGLNSGSIVPYYFGLGLDPCTLKPEICTGLVVDATFFNDNFIPNWKDGEEGTGVKVELDAGVLLPELAHSTSRWLSAGAACVLLAIKHRELLLGQPPA